MDQTPSCSLCRRQRKPIIAVGPDFFCAGCMQAMACFFRHGSHIAVSNVWNSRPAPPARDFKPEPGAMAKPLAEDRVAVDKAEPPDRSPIDDVFAELSESFSDAPDPSAESEFEYSVEEVYADFKAGLAAVLKPEDVETHLDLAIAYGEMGLLDDARAEAAIALEHGATSLRTRAAEAVAILLHPDGLTQTRADALASLRIALFPD